MIANEALQVSVVIGARNGGKHLLRTVRSVCAQQEVALECIVVDDGSNDDSAMRVAALADADSRIRLIRQRAGGLTRALITGCAEARAPLIARIDAGDEMLPGRLARQCEVLRDHRWIDVLGSLFRERGPDGETLVQSTTDEAGKITDLSEQQRSSHVASLSGIAHFSVCFRTNAYRRCGGYRPQFALAQDVDLWARMAQFGGVARLEEVLTLSRVSVSGLSPRHHQVQLRLRDIATAAVAVRAQGGDERPLLNRAHEESTRALGGDGEQAAATYYVASRLAQAGHWQAAMPLYRRAVDSQPMKLRYVLAWLRAWSRLGDGGKRLANGLDEVAATRLASRGVEPPPVDEMSVVIATCDRAPVLLQTIEQLLHLDTPPVEIIVVDQSVEIDETSRALLETHHRQNNINWIRRSKKSIPAAMNHGLSVAGAGLVLFLDDDVRIDCELVAAHVAAHAREGVHMVVGQVIQPWQQPLSADEPDYPPGRMNEPDAFRFNATRGQKVRRFMGGNVSVRRDTVVEMGGFDENFVGAAYRFEAEFSQRFCALGFEIYFEPTASIFHLKVPHGGTRGFGQYLAPWHSTGRYYYWLRHPRVPGLLRNTFYEALQCTIGRQRLRRPWLILPSACAELSGLALAIYHRLHGPRLPLARVRR